MKIEPSGLTGGAFVGLKNTVAAWAAPARNTTIAVTARILGSFVAVLKGDGSTKERDLRGWGFIISGVTGAIELRAVAASVVMDRASVQENYSILNQIRYCSIGLYHEARAHNPRSCACRESSLHRPGRESGAPVAL